jgi:hypothetical protein
VPEQVDGRPFLGPEISAEALAQRDETFGYADRFDEKYDLCRSLRKGRYKYIRNYQAFYPDGLQNNYRYRMLAYQQWRKLNDEGKLNAAQRRFFEPKPVEELYDLNADPHETNNLVEDPEHAKTLADLRGRLQQRVTGMPDLSFYPESYLVDHAMDNPTAFGQQRKQELSRLIDVADLSLLPFDEARPLLEKALASRNAHDQYWALIAGSCFGEEAQPLAAAARKLLQDEDLLVLTRAAEFLGIAAEVDPRPVLTDVLNQTNSPVEALLTLNTVVFFNDCAPKTWAFDVKSLRMKTKAGEVQRRLDYLGAGR